MLRRSFCSWLPFGFGTSLFGKELGKEVAPNSTLSSPKTSLEANHEAILENPDNLPVLGFENNYEDIFQGQKWIDVFYKEPPNNLLYRYRQRSVWMPINVVMFTEVADYWSKIGDQFSYGEIILRQARWPKAKDIFMFRKTKNSIPIQKRTLVFKG